MPRHRFSKPWLHQASGYYCTSNRGKRLYLDKDYRVACRKLRELRAEERRGAQPPQQWEDAPLADLADQFLEDLKQRKKPTSYRSYRYRLLRALRIMGPEIRVGEVRKLHLAKIEQELTATHSPTTVKDTIAAVQTVFNWAVRYELILDNPIRSYEKPRARSRTRIMTSDEFRALLRSSDPGFRRFLLALRLTGCRPGELRSLIWQWVDLADGFWVFPDHKTITRQRQPQPRVVPLPEPIWKMCRWLARRPHAATDHVFLNLHGQPYTKDCLVTKFQRVRQRAGIEEKSGERLVLYSARHTYATETAGRISDTELAELMGQTDTRTTRRYLHFSPSRLREIQRRAQA